MKRYSVCVSYTTYGYVVVEAVDEEDAKEKAYEAAIDGDINMENEFDEPDYEFDVEEIIKF